MTITPTRQQPSVDEARPEVAGELSRRRIIQGVAWATPAVVIAAATPATAASPLVPIVGTFPGGLVVSGASANQTESVLTVTSSAVFTTGGQAAAAPVGSVSTVISVPTARVGTGTASTASAGWVYQNKTTSGSNTLFTYQWVAGAVNASTPTGPLVALIPKTAGRTAFAVSVQSTGTSVSVPVTSPAVSATVGAYSLLTERYHNGGLNGTDSGIAALRGAVLVAFETNTAPVVGVTLTVRALTSTTTGGTPPYSDNSAWTYQGSSVSGQYTLYTFALVAGTLTPSYNQADFSIFVPRKHGVIPASYLVTIQGRSPNASGAVTSLELAYNNLK